MIAAASVACASIGCHAGGDGSSTPTLANVVAPSHPDGEPWTFVTSVSSPGPGTCATVSVDALANEVRANFPDVLSITSYRALGPTAPALDAGPGTPLGGTPPPATMTDSSFSALADTDSIGLVFYSGTRCTGQNCAVQD
jgi:hypothetical protein